MLRSIGKQSGGIHGVSSAEERKATVGRICRKEGFKPGKKERPSRQTHDTLCEK